MELELVNPDKIWDKFLCDCCHRFLSVNPIRVYPNKIIKCGRCSRNDNEGMISSFGFVASQFLFKCINRFDGCRKLLRNDQVEDHEKNCSSRKYFCPLCQPNSLELPTYLLMTHFQEQHNRNILEQPWMLIDLAESCDVNKLFLYKVDDHLFFITFESNLIESCLNSLYVGTAEKAHKIKQRYSLYSKDTNLELKTKSKFCDCAGSFSIGLSVKRSEFLSNEFIILIELDIKELEFFKMPFYDTTKIIEQSKFGKLQKIFLSSAYLNSNPKYSIDITGTALVITQIDSEKTISLQCSVCFSKICGFWIDILEGSRKSFCKYCLEYYKEKQPNAQISKLSIPQQLGNNLKFNCKWNCNALVPYQFVSIKHDENFCLLQPQRICPMDNCHFEGKLYDLNNHFVTSHDDAILYLNSSSTITYCNKLVPTIQNSSSGMKESSPTLPKFTFSTSLFPSSVDQNIVINKHYFFIHDKFVLLTRSVVQKKIMFSIGFCSKEEVDGSLQPAVIVFVNTTYVDTFRHSFVLDESTTGNANTIFVNVILEELGS